MAHSEFMEKRRLHRFRQALPTILTLEPEGDDAAAPREFMAYTEDVSASGAFFITEEKVGEGSEVRLCCLLPYEGEETAAIPGSHSLLIARGRVVRVALGGIAVTFSSQYEMKPVAAGSRELETAAAV